MAACLAELYAARQRCFIYHMTIVLERTGDSKIRRLHRLLLVLVVFPGVEETTGEFIGNHSDGSAIHFARSSPAGADHR